MIIIRVPLRISLGGGGTDLPSWYSKNGGFLISASINKYIYLSGSFRNYDKKFWLSYSNVEICNSINEIKHNIFKNVLKKYTFNKGIEIHSISEVPGGSGLGSSGSFTVGLIKLLNVMSKIEMTKKEIAEKAAYIEMFELKSECGKQDQYVASHGGIISMKINEDGDVFIEDLNLEQTTLINLNNNLLIYHTGYARDAKILLKEQNKKIELKNSTSINSMKNIQQIGYDSYKYLIAGDIDSFGKLLDEHWKTKKAVSDRMSSNVLDEIYNYAIQNGALGGKIMGAGGGGFFMFYVSPEKQNSFRKKMKKIKLNEMNWQFDFHGVNKIFSD